MERMVDGAWVPVDQGELEDKTWTDIEALFKEVDAGAEVERAAGPVVEDSPVVRDLAVPVDSAGAGSGEVVQVGQGSERGQGVAVGIDANDVVDEIPGLTTSDGKTGTRGSRSTLQKLRERANKKTSKIHSGTIAEKPVQSEPVQDGTGSQPVPIRSGIRIEVGEAAAKPRGPAVRDTTERRQVSRETSRRTRAQVGGASKGSSEMVRVGTKPSPGILSGQPKWVRDLFEAHFRSSRTRELRSMPSGPSREVDGKVVTPNRMKMSREDFAIGWLVLLEAARKEPAIIRARVVNGVVEHAVDGHAEGLPVLSAPSNTV